MEARAIVCDINNFPQKRASLCYFYCMTENITTVRQLIFALRGKLKLSD